MEKTEGFEGKNSYAQLLRCGRTYLEAHGIEDAQYYHPKHSGMETKIAPWLEQYRAASQSGQTTAD